jgi:hypothetical protein
MNPFGHYFRELGTGTAYPFSEWPKPNKVPKIAVGVYTIWHQDGRFMYVGWSGRDRPLRKLGRTNSWAFIRV